MRRALPTDGAHQADAGRPRRAMPPYTAYVTSASCRSAPARIAHEKFVPFSCAFARHALVRSAPSKSAPRRSAPVRLVPTMCEFRRDLPERAAPDKSCPEKMCPERSSLDMSTVIATSDDSSGGSLADSADGVALVVVRLDQADAARKVV